MKINSMFKNQQFIFLIAVVAAGLGTLWILGDLASPILLSIVLAFLFRPLLIYLVQIGVPRSVSVVVTFLVSMLVGIGFFLIFVPMFINEAQRYLQEIPSLQFLIEPINNFLSNINVPIDSLDSAQSLFSNCLLYTSPSPRDRTRSRMPSSA